MSTGISISIPADRYRAHRAEIDASVAEVFRSGRFILGEQTSAFEKEFAAFIGVNHCVGVASGTDAIEMALRAFGIGRGDAVLTVAHTAVATVSAIERAGADPVFTDIDAATFTMAPESLERTIAEFQRRRSRPKLKAIIPVHLYGHAADMPAILSVARSHRLRVVEDCAQSHGASLNGRLTGTWGDAAAFSFYPTKNLGAFGDGGAVLTQNTQVAERLRSLREYGWKHRYVSAVSGVNSRLDELQAGTLRVSLKHLAAENKSRRAVAEAYAHLLAGTALFLPEIRDSIGHAFHQFVIRTRRRDALRQFLETRGVPTQIHYPVPIHRQPAYRGRCFISRSGLPNTDAAAREVLSLPMSPYLTRETVAMICSAVRASFEKFPGETV